MDASQALRALFKVPPDSGPGARSSTLTNLSPLPKRNSGNIGVAPKYSIDAIPQPPQTSSTTPPQAHSPAESGATFMDLSFTDSEPCLSPTSSRQHAGTGAAMQASSSSRKLGAHDSAVNASMRLLKSATAHAGMQTQFAWMRTLTREQRQRLRQCKSPHAALATLSAMHDAENFVDHSLTAPTGLLEDLQKHLRTTQMRIMDLEEELARQASVHQAEIIALHDEHRQACRREKLELLARYAPDHNAGVEALACDMVRPALGPTVETLINSPYNASIASAPRRSRGGGNRRDCHTPSVYASVACKLDDGWHDRHDSSNLKDARSGLHVTTVTQPAADGAIAPPTMEAPLPAARTAAIATKTVAVAVT